MRDDFYRQIDELTVQQGWSDPSVGSMAISFLANDVDAPTRERFIAHLRAVQAMENSDCD